MLLKVGPMATGANYLFMGAEDLSPGSLIPEREHEVDEEILLVHRSRVRVMLNGDTTEAGSGDVIFLPPRSRVSVRALPPDTATVYFVFSRGGVERCFPSRGPWGRRDGAAQTDPCRHSRGPTGMPDDLLLSHAARRPRPGLPAATMARSLSQVVCS
jgi:hypothetical protein